MSRQRLSLSTKEWSRLSEDTWALHHSTQRGGVSTRCEDSSSCTRLPSQAIRHLLSRATDKIPTKRLWCDLDHSNAGKKVLIEEGVKATTHQEEEPRGSSSHSWVEDQEVLRRRNAKIQGAPQWRRAQAFLQTQVDSEYRRTASLPRVQGTSGLTETAHRASNKTLRSERDPENIPWQQSVALQRSSA